MRNEDEGMFKCVAKSEGGIASEVVGLRLNGKFITCDLPLIRIDLILGYSEPLLYVRPHESQHHIFWNLLFTVIPMSVNMSGT